MENQPHSEIIDSQKGLKLPFGVTAPSWRKLTPWLVLLAVSVLVVGSAFTFTNYGLVLDYFGVHYPRLLPPSTIAADIEYYMFTPLQQIAVNNDFSRINGTSPYAEDLRTIFSLPILDPFLIFKPDYWGYFVLPPANAFALHNWMLVVAFVVGYIKLFEKLGAPVLIATPIAITFFFSPFLQYWLPNFLPIMAYWPWLILAACHRNVIVAGLGTFYIGTVWLTSHIYPPVLIPLVITGAAVIFIAAPKEGLIKRLAILAPAAAAAAGLVYWYLHDAIAALQATSYPGSRISSGGESTDFAMWWSQFIPTHFIQDQRPLISIEAPEAAGAGSILYLMLLFFVDYRTFLAPENKDLRTRVAILAAPLLIMWAWILIPLPSWTGWPLLLPLVSPRRLVFGAGALMCLIAVLLLAKAPLRITWARATLVGLIAVVSWLSLPYLSTNASPLTLASLLDLSPVLIAPAVWGIHKLAKRFTKPAMVGFAMLVNVTAFGGFWGIQSATPIFNRPQTELTKSFDFLISQHPDKLLVLPGERFNGALMNGWGYRSAAHAFFIPHSDYMRQYFPDVSDTDFAYAFNRMSILRIVPTDKLSAPGIGVMVPARSAKIPHIRAAVSGRPAEAPTGRSGDYQSRIEDGKLIVDGWARFQGISPEQKLYIELPSGIGSIDLIHTASPLPGAEALGGFNAEITPPPGVSAEAYKGQAINVFSSDPAKGIYQLDGAGNVP